MVYIILELDMIICILIGACIVGFLTSYINRENAFVATLFAVISLLIAFVVVLELLGAI